MFDLHVSIIEIFTEIWFIFKGLLINNSEFDELPNVLLEDMAPTAEVEFVLTLLADFAVVVVVVAAVGLSVDGIGATEYNTNVTNKQLSKDLVQGGCWFIYCTLTQGNQLNRTQNISEDFCIV